MISVESLAAEYLCKRGQGSSAEVSLGERRRLSFAPEIPPAMIRSTSRRERHQSTPQPAPVAVSTGGTDSSMSARPRCFSLKVSFSAHSLVAPAEYCYVPGGNARRQAIGVESHVVSDDSITTSPVRRKDLEWLLEGSVAATRIRPQQAFAKEEVWHVT